MTKKEVLERVEWRLKMIEDTRTTPGVLDYWRGICVGLQIAIDYLKERGT